MRRLFEQLNQIESVLSGVSAEVIEEKWVDYQTAKISANKGAPWSVRIRG
ncbi:MAG: hypothetical protein WBZ01_21680 [Terriglobales bacterium]